MQREEKKEDINGKSKEIQKQEKELTNNSRPTKEKKTHTHKR
jgi:hypothetical protein